MTDPERIAQLTARAQALQVEIAAPQAETLLRFLDLMLERNQQINLTGLRDPAVADVLHVLDSAIVARVGTEPHEVLDLGSGNGFPGVAAAVLFPAARVTLLDRTRKKMRAVEDLLRAAGIDNATTRAADAAQLPGLRPDLRRRYDLITARAVADPATVATLATHLLAPEGRLALWLTADDEPVAPPGYELARVIDYDLPTEPPRKRRLVVCER